MIALIAGRPKSGKSYEAVRYHIIPAIEQGRKVITNVPLDIEYFVKIYGAVCRDLIEVVAFNYSDFDADASAFPFSRPEDYQNSWRNEEGVGPLYVVDEAHFSLPRGKTPDAVKKFYTMHGHYGVDIVLLTQNIRQIDMAILVLVDIVHRTIKNRSLGSQNTYTKKVFDGYRGAQVNESQRRYDDRFFPFYKAHTQSAKAVVERETADLKPIWRHWSVYMAVPLFAFCIWAAFQGWFNPFPSAEQPDELQQPVADLPDPEPAATVRQPVVVRSPAPVVEKSPEKEPPPSHPFERVGLHVSGHLSNGQRTLYQIRASQNGQAVFSISSVELEQAGYDVEPIGPCAVRVRFGKWDRILICDAPRISVPVPAVHHADH